VKKIRKMTLAVSKAVQPRLNIDTKGLPSRDKSGVPT
jgi:hypothetical protein